MRSFAAVTLCCAAALVSGCSSAPMRPAGGYHHAASSPAPAAPAPAPAPSSNPSQDGPPAPEEIPPNVAQIPDAVPAPEPKSSYGNPDSYEVYGDRYVILKDPRGYKERGYASWYGKKFQGKRTSSGEPYDMFKMTAAHKTLPIPCYAKVTNIENGHSVIVRINDRGPFHEGRIIDLSYTAAVKLGSLGRGSIPVEVEAVDPSAPPQTMVASSPPPATPRPRPAAPQAAAPAAPPAPVPAPATPAPQPAPAAQSAAPVVAAAVPPPRPAVPVVTLPPGERLAMSPTLRSTDAAAPAAAAPPAAPPPPAALPSLPTQVASVAGSSVVSALRYLQAGLFYDPINAVSLREQLAAVGITNVQLKNDVRNGASVSRVLIGPFPDEDTLALVRKRLGDLQLPAVPVVE
jgi:rare lipoprotein A